jgi:cell division protein FtsL
VSGRAAARSAAPAPRTTSPRSTPRTTTRATPSRPELRLVPGATAVRPRRRVTEELSRRRAPFVLLVVALLVGTTLGLLILNTAIAVDSLKATELRAANAERAEEVQRLEQQVVSGGAPARIAEGAAKAGMVPAGPAAFLVIAADGSSTLRGTPEPAEAPEAPAGPPAPPAQGPVQAPAPAAVGTAGGG